MIWGRSCTLCTLGHLGYSCCQNMLLHHGCPEMQSVWSSLARHRIIQQAAFPSEKRPARKGVSQPVRPCLAVPTVHRRNNIVEWLDIYPLQLVTGESRMHRAPILCCSSGCPQLAGDVVAWLLLLHTLFPTRHSIFPHTHPDAFQDTPIIYMPRNVVVWCTLSEIRMMSTPCVSETLAHSLSLH